MLVPVNQRPYPPHAARRGYGRTGNGIGYVVVAA
jgi:hypothetical protein